MAIGIVVEIEGASLAYYDAATKSLGLSSGGEGPPGCIFHWVAKTDNGIRVTDVWETREDFDAFSEAAGATPLDGFESPPKMTFFDVHSYLTSAKPA